MNQDVSLPPILYFGNDWSAENRTSSHQIARWLAKRFKVYYIECPGLRAPKSSSRDFKKIWAKVARFLRGPRTVPEGLTVWTLLQLPLHRFRLVRLLNRLVIRVSLRWLKWREGIHEPLTWFMIPHLPSVVGRLGEVLSIYYCIDDYAALPDVNVDAVKSMDEQMTRNAGLVFVASDTLFDSKVRQNANTHVSPHGVDVEHFAQARDPRGAVPADVTRFERPIIGFFGLIEKWIDLDLVDYLAQQRPKWTFVMIGRVAIRADEIPRRANIHFLGARPYETLPQYGRQFDAAIIPYRLTQQVLHANPIKLREYLAMGKPVISVSTPEIDKYADVVKIVRTREEFLSQLDAVVNTPRRAADVEAMVSRIESESWDRRLESVIEIIKENLRITSSRIVGAT